MLAWPFHYACQRLLCTQHYYPPCFILLSKSLQWHESSHSRCQSPLASLILVSVSFLFHFPLQSLSLVINLQLCSFIGLNLFWSFLCHCISSSPPCYSSQMRVEKTITDKKKRRKTWNPEISCFSSHVQSYKDDTCCCSEIEALQHLHFKLQSPRFQAKVPFITVWSKLKRKMDLALLKQDN